MDNTFYFETMARRTQRELATAAEFRRRIDERAETAVATPARPRLFVRLSLRRLRTHAQTA